MIQWVFSGIGTMLLSTVMGVTLSSPPPERPNWTLQAKIELSAPRKKDKRNCWDLKWCIGGAKVNPELVLCIESRDGVPYCPNKDSMWVKRCADTLSCEVEGTIPDEPEFRVWLLDLDWTRKGFDIVGTGKCRPNVRCKLEPRIPSWNAGSVFIQTPL
ncbi:MAG: hypothetical protein ABJO52_24355 [Nisaea sp.]|uniref:hypothetical protein n=1 Tax=Nisaea sp. TaxID=2024842 RepID=UPI00329900E8